MPIYLPKPIPNVLPWDACMVSLEAESAPSATFAKVQRDGKDLAGYIIGGWDEDHCLNWYYMCASSDPWERFDDEGRGQNPQLFKTLAKISKKISQLRERLSGDKDIFWRVVHVGMVLWTHPEAHYQPEEGCILLSQGERFPGSPRQ